MNSREEFLRAQYDEDEQVARRALEWWDSDREAGYLEWPSREASAHVTRHHPARELAEVEMKRRLLTEIAPKLDEMCRIIGGESGDTDDLPDGDDLRKILAEAYPDRPCRDCAVLVGQAHDDGCDIAACTLCGQQRIICAHGVHEGGWGQIWTGEIPGVGDALRLGVDLNQLGRMAKAGLVKWDQTHQRWEPSG